MEKQVETLTTELEESTTTQQALQEQIEKLTVQLQKVEAENKPTRGCPTRSDCETAHGGVKE